MANTRDVFLPQAGEYPVTGAFPQLLKIRDRFVLAYDAAADETILWTSVAPQGLTGTIKVIVKYAMASATSGAVRFQAAIEAITDGDATDLDAGESFGTANSAGDTVPATAGYPGEFEITMTNADSLAAGDSYRLKFNRDADQTSGTDDAGGDCYVLSVEVRDAA